MYTILVVDDEKNMQEWLAIFLRKEGYDVKTAGDGASALKILEHDPVDLVLTDIKMPKVDGMELIRMTRVLAPDTVVVIMTAFASKETAIEAIKLGAYDYLTKPFQVDDIKLVIKNALEKHILQAENQRLNQALQGQIPSSHIVGSSQAIQKVFELIERVAPSKCNVLLLGESGTGKDLAARAIHHQSPRQSRPFISVNCSALQESLLESELFGHAKGAFTGATDNKLGLFEVADGGTLFLDEIADMPLAIQAKLLRVLQDQEFRRVGGVKTIRVDVRVITATNKDIKQLVADGTFREDLYYRLDVFPIHLPALRERPEDIPLLVEHFIRKFDAGKGQVKGVTPEVLRMLMAQPWKGNIRELANVLERAIVLTPHAMLTLSDFDQGCRNAVTVPVLPEEGLDHLMNHMEKQLLTKALESAQGIKKEAARLLQVDLRSFLYRLHKYGIGENLGNKEESEKPEAAS